MRICMVCKYPPIQGGESAKAYWLLKALGAKGHQIHVVTNAMEVEEDYRENLMGEDLNFYQPPNVIIHNTDPFIEPFYIPYAKPYIAKLASYAIEIIRNYDIPIIDSWYILPYGVSAFIAKILTQRPQILRHAGSDLSRLLNSPYLHTLFIEILRSVDKVVTYPATKERLIAYGVPESKIFLNTRYSIDTTAFNPDIQPIDLSQYVDRDVVGLPLITYLGKASATKGVLDLVKALSLIKGEFISLFITGGKGIDRLKTMVSQHGLGERTIFVKFVPPWRVPAFIKASTCVVLPEHDFPVPAHTPTLIREVLACGTCLMISEELYQKRVSAELVDGENLLVVNPTDTEQFRSKLERVIEDPTYACAIGRRGWEISRKVENFEEYVQTMESLYREMMSFV